MFVRMLGDSGVTVSTVVMTMVILLFGEVAPKSLARISNEKIAFAGYPLLTFIVKIFTPLSFLMGCWQKLMGRLVRDSEEHGITEEELITMVEEAESDGEIDSHESELIRSAIEFTDLCVEDILTPRVDMVASSPRAASPACPSMRTTSTTSSASSTRRTSIATAAASPCAR